MCKTKDVPTKPSCRVVSYITDLYAWPIVISCEQIGEA
jgi:hypothetical protein